LKLPSNPFKRKQIPPYSQVSNQIEEDIEKTSLTLLMNRVLAERFSVFNDYSHFIEDSDSPLETRVNNALELVNSNIQYGAARAPNLPRYWYRQVDLIWDKQVKPVLFDAPHSYSLEGMTIVRDLCEGCIAHHLKYYAMVVAAVSFRPEDLTPQNVNIIQSMAMPGFSAGVYQGVIPAGSLPPRVDKPRPQERYYEPTETQR
jgi:hypothetical protein